ncbi:hypothetical protein B7486_28965 [cyanobacterium TDX16]|nr:hypothetical protein B7486_28965 [cyanobacterium TDX16]
MRKQTTQATSTNSSDNNTVTEDGFDNLIAKYESSQYDGKITDFPICQVLNDKSPASVGMFVKAKNLPQIGWRGSEATYEHTFSSGATELGVLLQSPRMHILRTSPRCIELRKTGEIIANYENIEGRKKYEELGNLATLRTFYLIYLVDESSNNLHDLPLLLSIKGVAAVRFGEAYRQFKRQLEIAYANRRKTQYKPKDERFHVTGIFNPTFKPSLEPPDGEQKSWVAIPGSNSVPAIDGCDLSKFLAPDKEDELWAIVQSSNGFSNNILKVAEEHDKTVESASDSTNATTIDPKAVAVIANADELPY